MQQKKWDTDNLPNGYPGQCDDKQLKEVIQDLSDEYYQKTQKGKFNNVWEKLISERIKSGRDELRQRIEANKKFWFSMNNPVIYIIVVLSVVLITWLLT